jgi:exopolyphosphatase/guanosine-5'-triphosphate,3'-diphosphate pyrophosphatase
MLYGLKHETFNDTMNEKQAIIDLGSNTTRMLIIEVTDRGAYHLVEEDKGVVRLSEDTMPDGIIKDQAFKRTVKAMKLFRGMCNYHEVSRITAVATAAVREAMNQEEFLGRLTEETGIAFRVLSREEEPYFGYLGVINTMDLKNGLIMDLGGGSMEITAVKDRKLVRSTSIPYGALTLTEKFLDPDKPSDSELKDLEAFVREKLNEIPWLSAYTENQLIGIGGTIRTIARMDQRMSGYPFDELHNYFMSPSDVSIIYSKIRSMDMEDRKKIPGLSRDRADIIVAGTAAINTLARYLKVPYIRVSSSGLRDGLFFKDYLKSPIVDDITEFGLKNIANLYRVDMPHTLNVAQLARSLLLGLKKEFRLDERDGRVLYAASMLHELGDYYDFGKRHNNTFYNIVDNAIFGFTHMDNYRTALVAGRFGSGGIKGRSTFLNVRLDKEDVRTIKKLSVILGLADAFDRSRRKLVTSLDCRIVKDAVIIKPMYTGDISVELTTAAEINGYFKKAFDMDLIINP